MKLLIGKLACKVLTLNSDFCNEIGLFGTLGIPENDPIYKVQQKEMFDNWLITNGIDPTKFWLKFDEFLKSKECREDYSFIYNPALKPWEQMWD